MRSYLWRFCALPLQALAVYHVVKVGVYIEDSGWMRGFEKVGLWCLPFILWAIITKITLRRETDRVKIKEREVAVKKQQYLYWLMYLAPAVIAIVEVSDKKGSGVAVAFFLGIPIALFGLMGVVFAFEGIADEGAKLMRFQDLQSEHFEGIVRSISIPGISTSRAIVNCKIEILEGLGKELIERRLFVVLSEVPEVGDKLVFGCKPNTPVNQRYEEFAYSSQIDLANRSNDAFDRIDQLLKSGTISEKERVDLRGLLLRSS